MSLILLSYLIMISAAICMILTNNPVYGLKFLIIIFLNFSFLLIYYNLIYLGLIFITVYVGAVTILFLFVVMMLDIKYNIVNAHNYMTIGFFFTFLLSIIIFTVINYNLDTINTFSLVSNEFNSINELVDYPMITKLGIIIYNQLFVGIFIIGILLLVATIGAISITHSTETIPVRKEYNQLDMESTFLYTLYNK